MKPKPKDKTTGKRQIRGLQTGVASQGSDNSQITKEQREILDLLTNQYLTPKQIAYSRNTTTQAVYKTMKKLKDKGLLSGTVFKGLQKVEPLRMGGLHHDSTDKGQHIRLHGQEFNINILTTSKAYHQTLLKSNVIDFKGHTARLYKNSIELYSKKDFVGEDAQRATALSIQYFNKIFYQLEDYLKIVIMKPKSTNIRQVNAHYAEINNEVAEECNEKKIKMRIFTEEDGKLWFKIDNSFQLNEMETLHPKTSKQDMEALKPFFNDLRKNPVVLSEMMSVMDALTQSMKTAAEINKDTAAGLNAVVTLLKGPQEVAPKEKEDSTDKPGYIR